MENKFKKVSIYDDNIQTTHVTASTSKRSLAMSEIKEIARKILQLDNEISPQTKMSLADELAKKVLNEFGGVEVSAKGDCLNEKNVEDFFDRYKKESADGK